MIKTLPVQKFYKSIRLGRSKLQHKKSNQLFIENKKERVKYKQKDYLLQRLQFVVFI
jgi:hypothetical protein